MWKHSVILLYSKNEFENNDKIILSVNTIINIYDKSPGVESKVNFKKNISN